METTIKHFKGLMKPENMDAEWLEHWRHEALSAANEGEEIMFFKLPKGTKIQGELIVKIEQLLQSEA